MAINIRCPKCNTDNGKKSLACKRCETPWEGTRGIKYRLVPWLKGKRLPIQTFNTLKDAERKELKYKVQKNEGRLGISKAPKLKEIWLELFGRMKDPDRKEFKKSWNKDVQRYRDFIAKPLGNRRMDTIVDRDVKKILDKMAVTPHPKGKFYSPATREQVRKIIARLYNWAKRQNRYTGHNPTNDIFIRVNNERSLRLELIECARLLGVCDIEEYGKKWPEAAAIVKIAVLTGRRRGEICEMRWEHVDWALNLYKNIDTKSGEDLVLTMPEDVQELLHGIGRQDIGLIFQNSKNNDYYYSLEARWQEIKKLAELPEEFHFHDLRHSFATAYASSGEGDIYRLQKLLGHKTIAMTQRYAHLFDEARQADANVVANQIRAAMEKKK